jgi:hypothetical protein
MLKAILICEVFRIESVQPDGSTYVLFQLTRGKSYEFAFVIIIPPDFVEGERCFYVPFPYL